MPYKDPEKHKARCRAYYRKHRDEILERSRSYRASRRSEISSRMRLYYEANKERIKKQKKDYYESHRDQKLEYNRSYYRSKKNKIRERKRVYNQSRMDIYRAQTRIRKGLLVDPLAPKITNPFDTRKFSVKKPSVRVRRYHWRNALRKAGVPENRLSEIILRMEASHNRRRLYLIHWTEIQRRKADKRAMDKIEEQARFALALQ